MKISDYAPKSKSLDGKELAQRPRVLTISKWEEKKYDDSHPKLQLSFHECEETLTLNKTRSNAITDLFGDGDPDMLIGKRIMVTGRRLPDGKFKGQYTVDIVAPPGQAQPQPQEEIMF